MPEVQTFTSGGTAGKAVTLSDDVFNTSPNAALLHQAVVRQLADKRQGTHDTLTRGEVTRTTKKVWRQKGTGRARQGSRKGPHWTGGGVAFGPHPRSHNLGMPRKMRAAAIRSALGAKVSSGDLLLMEEVSLKAPSTKELSRLLASVAGDGARSVLLMLDGPQREVQLSARNLRNVTAATTENINVYDLLRHQRIVMTVAAARLLEERYGKGASQGTSTANGSVADAGDEAATAPKSSKARRSASAETSEGSDTQSGAAPDAGSEGAGTSEKPARRTRSTGAQSSSTSDAEAESPASGQAGGQAKE